MAVSSFFGLQTALRGLTASQRGLDITGHNIANASTEGYTRQRADFVSSVPLKIDAGAVQGGGGAQLGSGVEVGAYRRLRDSFLDLQARAASLSSGQHDAEANALGKVEDALGEPSDGSVSTLLSRFWSTWGALANDPSSTAARETIVGSATTLAQSLKELDARLAMVGTDAAAEFTALTGPSGEVLNDANEIAKLNSAIKAGAMIGEAPNDLMDRRDLLVDRLSALAQTTVTDNGDGTIDIKFGDAALPLVTATTTVNWPQAITSAGSSGKLGALLAISQPGGVVASLRADLDLVATNLIAQVNAIHPTAIFSGTSAATIGVVATAATIQATATGNAGANEIATALSQLRGSTAVDGAYKDLVARIGVAADDANRQATTAAALVSHTEDRRAAADGVSMDEELTNMITFQRAYQASSRTMTTLDDMLDTLINRTGKVGL